MREPSNDRNWFFCKFNCYLSSLGTCEAWLEDYDYAPLSLPDEFAEAPTCLVNEGGNLWAAGGTLKNKNLTKEGLT